jgi:hypothetical protein
MSKGTAVPLVALLTSAALAIVVAAQTSLSCTDKVAVPMPGMDMGPMSGPDAPPAMMVCPVVLGLIVASVLLLFAAFVMLWRDPHRALTQRAILLALCRLPPVRTAGTVALAGGSAVCTMLWLERSVPPALPACAMLAVLLFACSVVATLAAIAAGRIAMAFGRRLILAIAAAIVRAGDAVAARRLRFVPIACGVHAAPLLSAGRGLRAPPPFVR